MRFAPDPIAFLLPIGHQRATHSAYRTSLRENLLGRALFERHDELARTVPTVPYPFHIPERFPPAPLTTTLQYQLRLSVRARHARSGGPP